MARSDAPKREALQAIKGMDDVLPLNASDFIYRAEHWTAVRRAYSEWAELHGYGYIETPALEFTELFKRTAGETSDIVSKEMYTFDDPGGRTLSLRPEGSAAVCRAIIEHGIASSAPQAKLYYIAQMFRAESPQLGRYRQHTQLGAELFKESDPTADAEVIALILGFYRRLGLRDITLEINSVGSPACRPAYREALLAHLEPQEGRLSEDSRKRLRTNPMRVLDSKAKEDQEIVAAAPIMLDHLDPESREHFEGVKKALESVGITYRINPRLVRGLDYYTRTAFEIRCGTLTGAIQVISGGGRYDGLVEQIGGPPTPAVGFGASIERLLLACKSQGITPGRPLAPEVVVCYFEEHEKWDAFKLAAELREAGIRTQFTYQYRKMGKQLTAAAKTGARVAVIYGGLEAIDGTVRYKDLQAAEGERGKENVVERGKVAEALKGVLGGPVALNA